MKKLMKQLNIEIDKPWVDFYDEDVPKSIVYPNKMMWEVIQDSVLRNPNKLAYEYYGTSVSFKKFMFEIEEAARALKSIGVSQGDVVSIVSPNIPQAIVLFYAVNMVGAIANMIHPLSAVDEIRNYLDMSKSSFVFVVDIAALNVLKVVDRNFVKRIVVMNVSEKMNKITKFVYECTKGKSVKVPYDDELILSWNSFLDFGYMFDDEFKVHRDPNECAVILYSGGTTGTPKGIKLSDMNFNSVTLQTASMIQPVIPGQSILTIMPIFHAFGLDVCIHTPLSLGVKCILIPTFNFKKFGRLIKQYKPNFIVGVPTLLETMINDEKLQEMDLSFVKCIITGGDVISVKLKNRVDKFMKDHGSSATARPGYGLTEGCGASCLMPANFQPEGSIGVPCQDVLYRIVDPVSGFNVTYGQEGEILISGPSVMLGYLNNDEETDKVLVKDSNGRVWLRTGDIGKMDENGFVYFVQRLKRVIVSSGYNLYPSHIEDVILKNPLVESVCVIGVSHPYKTQVAKAFVVLSKGVVASDNIKRELRNHCEKFLAKYSIPYMFEFIDELPKTNVGKIAYKVLEEQENSNN